MDNPRRVSVLICTRCPQVPPVKGCPLHIGSRCYQGSVSRLVRTTGYAGVRCLPSPCNFLCGLKTKAAVWDKLFVIQITKYPLSRIVETQQTEDYTILSLCV